MTVLNPYPEYKDCNVEWLGEIPSHWNVQPFFAVSRENRRSNRGLLESNLLSLSYGKIVSKDINTNEGLLPESFETYQIVEPKDIVFRLTDLQNDKRSLRSAIVPERGIITSAYLSVRVLNDSSRFMAYVMRDADLRKVFYSMGGGLRQSMKFADMRRLPVQLPPRAEQRAIASFLDHETAEIDAFIADQQELIGLLNERRAATITQAVTKGLDPNVPMKDSGFEWLGKVPQHWVIHKFSRCVRISAGQVDPKTDPYIDWVLIAPNHVESGTGKLLDLQTSREQGAESGKYVVSQGQLIYSKIRPNLMKVIKAPTDCLCSADMYGLDADSRQLTNDYLQLLLLSGPFHDYAVDQSMRVAMPKLNHETLNAVPLWFPALEEQALILKHVNYELTQIDAAIVDAREAIELSKERRAALISAAVTGKIDVRDHPAAVTGKIDVRDHPAAKGAA